MKKNNNNTNNMERRPATRPIPLSENSIKAILEGIKAPQKPNKSGK